MLIEFVKVFFSHVDIWQSQCDNGGGNEMLWTYQTAATHRVTSPRFAWFERGHVSELGKATYVIKRTEETHKWIWHSGDSASWKILIIKPTICTNFSDFSNGVCHTGLLTACLQAVRKPVWHTPLLCAQWKNPDDGQRNCPKHEEFYSKNKFEKLVHINGFIIRTHKWIASRAWWLFPCIKLSGQCRVLFHAGYESEWKRVYVQVGREIDLQLHRLVNLFKILLGSKTEDFCDSDL